jgi:branched-chain amino acid transport system permease protein
MKSRAIGWLAVLTVGLVLPWAIYPVLAVDVLAWGLFAAAFDILLGYTGLLSFGHAAFFGMGAYGAALVAVRAGVPFPFSAIAGALAAGLLALPLMALSIRRAGISFAMITLAFAQMVFYVVNEWRGLTGGENGITGIPRGHLFSWDLSSATAYYYAAFPIVALGVLLCWRIVRSPFGRVLLAIRENPVRTESLGYPVSRYKLMATVLSCTLSGLAGGVWVMNHGFVALDAVHWSTSGTVVVMVLLGGMATRLGPLIGAALVILLRDFLSTWTDAWGIATGTIFIAVILVFRQGIVGTIERLLAPRAAPSAAHAPSVDKAATTAR